MIWVELDEVVDGLVGGCWFVVFLVVVCDVDLCLLCEMVEWIVVLQ